MLNGQSEEIFDGGGVVFPGPIKDTTGGNVHSTHAGGQSAVKILANAVCCLSLKHHGQVGIPNFRL